MEEPKGKMRKTNWRGRDCEVLLIDGTPFACQLCGKGTRRNQMWFFWDDGHETRTCSACGLKLAADHGVEGISIDPTAKWYRRHNIPKWERDLSILLRELEDISYQHAVFSIDKPEHTKRSEWLEKLRLKRKEIIELFWEVGELALDMTRVKKGK